MNRVVTKRPETLKLKLIYFFRYLSDAGCYLFLPVFFTYLSDSYGWNKSIIEGGTGEEWKLTLLFATIPAMAIIGNIVAGRLAGKEKKNKKLILFVMPIELTALVLIGALGASVGYEGNKFFIILIFSLIANAFNMTVYTLLDSSSGDVVQAEGGKFSQIRIFGSIPTVVGLYLVGPISGAFGENKVMGYSMMIICFAMCLVVSYALIWLLKPYDIDDYKEVGASAEEAKSVESYTYKDLLKQKSFIVFAIFAAFSLGFSFVVDNTFSAYWTNAAFSKSNSGFGDAGFQFYQNNMLSVAAGTRTLVETLVVIACTPFIKTKNLKKIIAIPGIAVFIWPLGLGILTLLVTPNAQNASGVMAGLISIDSLRGFIWGPYIAVSVPIIENLLGIKLKTKGLFAMTILYQGFNLVGQLVSTYIIKGLGGAAGHGYAYFFFILAGLAALNLVNLFFFKINLKKTGTSVKVDEVVDTKTDELIRNAA